MGAESQPTSTGRPDAIPSSAGEGAKTDDPAPASYPTDPETAEATGDPVRCEEHGLIHPEARPWLPKQERGDLAPHPYCPECGEVKALGGRTGLDKGGLVNLVSQLEKDLEREGHVVTDVQKRLLMKRITERDLDDAYGFTRNRQLELVAEMAGEILGLPTNVVRSYLNLG